MTGPKQAYTFHGMPTKIIPTKIIPLVMLFLAMFTASAQRVNEAVLKNAGKTGDEWLTYGLTPGETRYSPLNQINATNVGRLGLAWSYDVGPGGGNQEATPLVFNGAIYSITNWSIVFAGRRTNRQRTLALGPRSQPDRRPSEDLLRRRQSRPCHLPEHDHRPYHRWPARSSRCHYRQKPVWESRVSYPQDNYSITMAPRIAKGKVIIGVAGGEYPVRGFFSAFDANTGHFEWKFYTVPGDPSQPFENPALAKAATTWDGEWWKYGGGASIWDGMAYDPEADLLYVGTGNGGPWPETLRQSKGKDNLFVASILAVKPDTGELKWYYQPVPGDSWDYDSVQQLLLADITIKGRPRKVLMQANKDGFYYVLDRVTGQFISGQPFTTVTWAKGLDEVTGRPIINADSHYGSDSIITLSPGTGGAQ